ncbi:MULTISPECIES: DUF2471 family protein [Pandoraea]|uniref:DUF2471 family protein n=1 Tax=Pandoraea TaxID=93217 RepID=UPI001F5D7507|nr:MULTISPECIES: DUF2471 family protein [Pandoraea]MCI3205671.1 hypothetical protein [Pandoraea sp. LA3]MDN4583699.1 hypothetical protein [Pandoraea capi]
METIDWDQLALSAAERDLASIVREIAARYLQHHVSHRPLAIVPANNAVAQHQDASPAMLLDWRTLVAIADEAEADIGLHARHEPWALARLLRLPGDEALRRAGKLPSLDAAVDLQWPDAPAPAVFRAIVSAFADGGLFGDTPDADDADNGDAPASSQPFVAGSATLSSSGSAAAC